MATIDLKKEQQATLARPRYKYSLTAKLFFLSMDLITGRAVTLPKAKLIETLASIPYRSWELRQYTRMTLHYQNQELVDEARKILSWGREAQDNEYWHLLVLNEKMKEDRIRNPWYLWPAIPFLMVMTYVLITRVMARFCPRRAYLFNAEFEDHAEHVYAQFVEDNKKFENQSVNNKLVRQYGDLKTWADVFRRIGLDERDHMNQSFLFAGKPELIVKYEEMPHIELKIR